MLVLQLLHTALEVVQSLVDLEGGEAIRVIHEVIEGPEYDQGCVVVSQAGADIGRVLDEPQDTVPGKPGLVPNLYMS